MHKDEIKNSLDKLNPTEEQSKAMWERLSKAIAQKETKKEDDNNETTEKKSNIVSFNNMKKSKKVSKVLTKVAAAIIIVVAAFAIDNATGGHVYAEIKELLDFDQGRQDIVGNIDDDRNEFYNIYAPVIYHMDEEMMIFGGLRGLIIYDYNNQAIMGTIDTQKIDCIYFESSNKKTHIVKDGNMLVVFNTENNKLYGDYYAFDLMDLNGAELAIKEQGNDVNEFNNYFTMWKNVDDSYIDTFDTFCEIRELAYVVDSNYAYSEKSFVWKNNAGAEFNSFLADGQTEYILYIYNTADGSMITKNIDLSKFMEGAAPEEAENGERVVLDEFIYTGDNKAIEAIYNYMKDEHMYMTGDETQVIIPSYIIFKEVEQSDECIVFGDFGHEGYKLTGNILESVSGACMPGCARLKKNGDKYEVVSMEFAGDGTMYASSIKEFTKDYPEVYDMYFADYSKETNAAREEFIRMYVSSGNLPVKYYKDYGCDPIKIFE